MTQTKCAKQDLIKRIMSYLAVTSLFAASFSTALLRGPLGEAQACTWQDQNEISCGGDCPWDDWQNYQANVPWGYELYDYQYSETTCSGCPAEVESDYYILWGDCTG